MRELGATTTAFDSDGPGSAPGTKGAEPSAAGRPSTPSSPTSKTWLACLSAGSTRPRTLGARQLGPDQSGGGSHPVLGADAARPDAPATDPIRWARWTS